jgi:hypothetical protein
MKFVFVPDDSFVLFKSGEAHILPRFTLGINEALGIDMGLCCSSGGVEILLTA